MLKNIISNWSNIFLSTLSVFVLYPYCVQTMGEDQYGVWLLISSITGYFTLLQLGVPLANVRFVSKHYALRDVKKVNEVVSSNFAFFTGVGLIVLLVGIGCAWLLDMAFQVPVEFNRMARLAIIIVSANISLSFVFEVFEGVLHALQEFFLLNLVKNILLVGRVALTFLILNFKNGLLVLASLLIVVTLSQALTLYLVIRMKYPEIKIRKRYIKIDVFKKVAGYSIFVLMFQVAGRISFNTDAIVIGCFISVPAVVFFTIGNNFLVYSMQFITGISKALMPKVSELDALGDNVGLQGVYLDYSQLTSFIVLPLCLIFFVFGGDFIAIWMGEKYRVISGNVLSILTISYVFFLVQRGVAFAILMGTSRLQFPTYFMFGTAILNLLLSIWWGKKYGLYGVAWGTTIPNLINTVAIIWFMCRSFNVRVAHYLYKGIMVPLSAGIFFIIPSCILRHYITINSYIIFFVIVLFSMFSYLLFLFLLYMDNEQKMILLKRIGFDRYI